MFTGKVAALLRHGLRLPGTGGLTLLLLLGCAGGGGPGGEAVPTPTESGGPPGEPAGEQPAQTPGARGRGLEMVASFTVIADSIPENEEMEALVTPFRERMGEEIREVIGRAAAPLAKAVPEGTLGNFAADAMLWMARRHSSEPVHMAMTNNGGLRVPIPPGPITVGLMFELMPFENMLSILTLSGIQVQELADQIAGMRGEPIAGFSFQIQEVDGDRVARNLRVNGEAVDPRAEYRLVTNDYLANGGGTLTPLHQAQSREDLPVLLRDAFIAYVREKGVIDMELEGRITGGIG